MVRPRHKPGHVWGRIRQRPVWPDSLAQRIRAVAHGAVAALPPALRSQAAAQHDDAGLDRLKVVMTVWSRAARIHDDAFAAHFLGRAGDDPGVGKLREAVLAINLAQGTPNCGKARNTWPRRSGSSASITGRVSLADAAAHARDPAAVAAVEKSRQPPDPRKDAIRPVYPAAATLGIAAAFPPRRHAGSSSNPRLTFSEPLVLKPYAIAIRWAII